MISKKASADYAKEVWDFGRTLGLVCEGDEEEVALAIKLQEERAMGAKLGGKESSVAQGLGKGC
jgi:hypothetical protein